MIKVREYRTQGNNWKYNDEKKIKKGEFFDLDAEPSLTIPDMTLTVQEILERFTRGGEVRTLRPQYLEDEPAGDAIARSIDLDQYDKMERLELLRSTRRYVDQVREEIQRRNDTKVDKAPSPSSAPVVDDLDGV